MNRFVSAGVWMAICFVAASVALAQDATTERKIFEQAGPSFVVVQYTFANELSTQEVTAAGVVVGEDGLVLIPYWIVNGIPADQMKDFKIIIPSDTADETEIDAQLQGRDERTNVAFVRAKTPQKWQAIHFVDHPVQVGETVYSVGLLPKGSGHKPHVTSATISAILRGPIPQVLVDGGLAGVGGVVFDGAGDAIGLIHPRTPDEMFLDNPSNPEDLGMIYNPPKLYVPSVDFLQSLSDPPSANKPIVIPWLGLMQLRGIEKEEAPYFDLTNKPAIQIGDVVPNSPSDKAGLKTRDIIVKLNGKPLERGDLPEELPAILARQIQRMQPGDKVTLSVFHNKGETPHDVVVTLEPRPKPFWETRRFYAEDLGFVVREPVFNDAYRRKLGTSTPGVVVALLRPEAAAQTAKLQMNALITQMNGKPVTDLDEFKTDYADFRKNNPKQAVVFEVSLQDGREMTVNIEPPQTDAVPGGGAQP